MCDITASASRDTASTSAYHSKIDAFVHAFLVISCVLLVTLAHALFLLFRLVFGPPSNSEFSVVRIKFHCKYLMCDITASASRDTASTSAYHSKIDAFVHAFLVISCALLVTLASMRLFRRCFHLHVFSFIHVCIREIIYNTVLI